MLPKATISRAMGGAVGWSCNEGKIRRAWLLTRKPNIFFEVDVCDCLQVLIWWFVWIRCDYLMVTSVSINQGGRFGKHSQRLGERKVQAELTEKQMQVSILEELWQLWILQLLFTVPDLGSTITESGEVLNFQNMKVHLGVSKNGGFSPQIIH